MSMSNLKKDLIYYRPRFSSYSSHFSISSIVGITGTSRQIIIYKKDLGIKQLYGYLACFIKKTQWKLSGVVDSYVEDTISIGDRSFNEESKLTERVFESNPRTYISFVFAGIHIERHGTVFLLQHTYYAWKLKELSLDSTYNKIRARGHEVALLNQTRLCLCAAM